MAQHDRAIPQRERRVSVRHAPTTPRKALTMTTTTPTAANVLHTSYQRSVAAYWNSNQQDPVNLRLGDVDGLYHHHYGIGEYEPSVLEGPEDTRDERIIKELHRLETMQANLLLDHLGEVSPGDRLLDGGSGRGGTSIMANRRFGCRVDGVTISEYQVEFANNQAEVRHEVARDEWIRRLEGQPMTVAA